MENRRNFFGKMTRSGRSLSSITHQKAAFEAEQIKPRCKLCGHPLLLPTCPSAGDSLHICFVPPTPWGAGDTHRYKHFQAVHSFSCVFFQNHRGFQVCSALYTAPSSCCSTGSARGVFQGSSVKQGCFPAFHISVVF